MTPILPRFAPICLLVISLGRAGADAAPSPTPRPAPLADRRLEALLALESTRARRLVQRELRLRLLELRERDLERVRLVIERKLSVDTLLGGETSTAAPRTPP